MQHAFQSKHSHSTPGISIYFHRKPLIAAMTTHPGPRLAEPAYVFCGQQAGLQLPTAQILPLLEALQRRLEIDPSNAELAINEILASHTDPKYTDWKIIVMDNTTWQLNDADQGPWTFSALGWVEENSMKIGDVLLACKKEAHVYGPSLSKQDDWNARAGTIAGTAHTQEYLLLHIAMFPIGAHTWCRVLGMPSADQLQAQIISRFFFPSNALWLPPGRSTCFQACCK